MIYRNMKTGLKLTAPALFPEITGSLLKMNPRTY